MNLWVVVVAAFAVFFGDVQSADVSGEPTTEETTIVACKYLFCDPAIVPDLQDRFGRHPARLLNLWFQVSDAGLSAPLEKFKSATCVAVEDWTPEPKEAFFYRSDGNVNRPSDCQRAYLAILEYEGPLPQPLPDHHTELFEHFSDSYFFFRLLKQMSGARFAFYGEDKSSGELEARLKERFPKFSFSIDDTPFADLQREQFGKRERSVRRFAPILMSEEASLRAPGVPRPDHDKFIIQWSLQFPHILDELKNARKRNDPIARRWEVVMRHYVFNLGSTPLPSDPKHEDPEQIVSIIEQIMRDTKCADWFPAECALWWWLLWQKSVSDLENYATPEFTAEAIRWLSFRVRPFTERARTLRSKRLSAQQSFIDGMMILRLVPVAREAIIGGVGRVLQQSQSLIRQSQSVGRQSRKRQHSAVSKSSAAVSKSSASRRHTAVDN